MFCNFNVIIKRLHVFKLCTGGLNLTKVQLDKVYSIYTHEVHLSTVLIHFILSSLCLCTYIYNYVV